MWYRIFGSNDVQPDPARLLEYLHNLEIEVAGKFHGDDHGWFRAELTLDGAAFDLERYLASEEGIRAQLNTWAAWLETVEQNPHRDRLMQHMIGTTQLFTLQLLDDDDGAERIPVALCRYLAQETAGVYQLDGQGFFAADGALLVAE